MCFSILGELNINYTKISVKIKENLCYLNDVFIFFFSTFNFLIEKTFQLLKKEKKEKRVKGLETEKKIRSN